MGNGTSLRQHPNAPLTPVGRRRMVACVLDQGWTVTATADRFQVDAKTVRKWRDRYLAEGEAGLQDRSSRPLQSPNRTPRQMRRKVCRIRKKRRWGADHIAFEVGLAASTVQNILNQAGLGRLDRGDRATDREPVHRYQRETPGELIHVDIKKIAGIPDGGGWRVRGRGYKQEKSSKHRYAGYRYIHTAIDDGTKHYFIRHPPSGIRSSRTARTTRAHSRALLMRLSSPRTSNYWPRNSTEWKKRLWFLWERP